jgi:hypothetical protein
LTPASAASMAWTRLRSFELPVALWIDSPTTVRPSDSTTMDARIAVTAAIPRSSFIR